MAAALAQRCTRSSAVASSRTAASRPAFVSSPAAARVQRRNLLVRVQAETAAAAGPVTEDNFEEVVLKSPIPVLIDFWAPWCGPCRMIAPIIDELASEYAGKLKCVKLNTDESPAIGGEYGIRSIPTVMIFKGGQRLETIIGAVPKATLVQSIEKVL
eukprot:jgi/Chrzof1/3921/Cz13g13140.t1_TRX2